MDKSTLRQLFVSLLFVICTASWAGISVDASRVTLNQNGYNDLVVAISSEAPVEKAETIISNIKTMILEASPVLYKATENRAYFQSVRILIPETWTDIKADPSTWETFDTADVIVDTPNPMHGDVPYTKQNGKCGEKGGRIHLTPDYVATLLEQQKVLQYGKPGKVFVHEWAHYRYGIFDEYGTPGGEYAIFRKSVTSAIEPNICANKPMTSKDFSVWDATVAGSTKCEIDPNTDVYDQNCRFKFEPQFKPTTSLASYHQLDSIVHFCKDDQHNAEAQNKHNDKCQRRSTWSVIMESEDFKNGNGIPVDLDKMHTEFQIVKATGARFVVVMDVSGSMKEFDRIGKLSDSIRAWIKTDLRSGSKLGMVTFSSTAEVVSDLQIISDANSREEMIAKIPTQLFSATCIGCGLELAVQMLHDSKGNDKSGGIIVLVTDGKNSPGYLHISDVQEDIFKAKIRVITIAFGEKADMNLEDLARKTEGKSYFVRDADGEAALQDAFLSASTFQSSVQNEDLTFKLFEKDFLTSAAQTDLVDEFDVDSTVGRNLKLQVFDLVNKKSVKSIELTGPDGDVVNNFVFDASTATLTVDLAKIGRWFLKVSLKSSPSKKVLVTVTTQMRPDVKVPITTKCLIPNGPDFKNAADSQILIQAEVWKGSHQVIGSSVRAYVVKPNGDTAVLELLDNGIGADATKDDGVYSKFFAYPNQQGRYTVKCQVKSNHNTFEILGFIGSASPQLFDRQSDDAIIANVERIPMADFTRIASAGSFQVEIPVSSDDSYPPADVTDLSVMVVNDTATNVSIALKWTAPGDDLDVGTVSYYELRYSDVVADVMNSNFDDESSIRKSRSVITVDDLVAGSLQPNEAGSLQMATFQLTNIQREKPYYLALRAVDKADKAGQVSNLVVFFIPDKSVVILTRNSEDDYSGDETDQEIHIHVSTKEPNYHVASMLVAAFGLILIACLGVTLLMAVVKHTQAYGSYKGVPV